MVIQADIVIAGGSFSAVAAALQAARMNPDLRVLLTEPDDWLGGQATAQGVSAIDNAWHNPGASLMREDPKSHYASDYLDFLERIKAAPKDAPGMGYGGEGVCWVSREAYDPRTGAWVLDQMVAEFPNLDVRRFAVMKRVESIDGQDGRRIISVDLLQRTAKTGYEPHSKRLSAEWEDRYAEAPSEDFDKQIIRVEPVNPAKGLVVVDATELGDVMVLSGAEYTVGRELTTEKFDESGNPPAIDETGSQAFVFVFCMSTAEQQDAESDVMNSIPGLKEYYDEQCRTFYSLGNFTFNKIWTYRRLYTTGKPHDYDGVHLGDISMQNWNPGNDYPHGTLLRTHAEVAPELADWRGGINVDQLAKAEAHAIGFYFYMKDHRTTTFDTRLARGSMAENMMDTVSGLARFPYVRCARRLVGLENFRIMSREFVDTRGSGYDGGTSFRYYDSVGIGSYASDVHPTRISQGISPHPEQPAPFYIPYRALASKNVRNLLAAGKNMAASYVTNSAYRLHPIEWASGTAAGAAAVLMHTKGLDNAALLFPAALRELQETVATISPIHWPTIDASPIPDSLMDVIVNDLRPIQTGHSFLIEVAHPTAAKACAFLSDGAKVECDKRLNGAFHLKGTINNAGRVQISIKIESNTGAILEERSLEVQVVDQIANAVLLDNFDAGFEFDGEWDLGNVIPDRYGLDYRHINGSGNPDKATAESRWTLDLPTTGQYSVEVWYPADARHASDAPFVVHHRDGATRVAVDQTRQGGRWVPLGVFPMVAGSSVRVSLNNAIVASDRQVVADAVRATLLKETKA